MKPRQLAIKPLTPGLWGEVEAFFADSGASAGCSCMFWRLERVLALLDMREVGWLSFWANALISPS